MWEKFTQMMSWRDLRDLPDLIGAPRPFESDEAVIGMLMRMSRVIHLDNRPAREQRDALGLRGRPRQIAT